MSAKLYCCFLPVMLLVTPAGPHDRGINNAQLHVLIHHSNSVVAAQNRFALKLFKILLKRDGSAVNKLISPLGIYLDLSMAYNGSSGMTKRAIGHALQLDTADTALLNSSNGALMHHLSTIDSAVDIHIANAVWFNDRGYQPLPSFLRIDSAYYQAKVASGDFNSLQVIKQVNQWIAVQTNYKIKSIIDRMDPSDIMYLINAVYFNGKWKNAFDTSRLDGRKRFFHLATDDSVKTDFMFRRGKLDYMQNRSLQMVALPYGKGDFNMYVLLPSPTLNLREFVNSLNINFLNRYIGSLDSVVVDLCLPTWEYRYKIDVEPELKELGMGIAFTRNADFTNMYPPNAKAEISKVVHKAFIKVDAEGTEASAVTSTSVIVGYSAPHHFKPPPVMNVNRPFLYIISDKRSGALLFIGEVNNPKEKQAL